MIYTYHINIDIAFLIVDSGKKNNEKHRWMNQIWIVMVIINPPFVDPLLDARLCSNHHKSIQYSIHSALHLCGFTYKQTAVQTHKIPNLKKWLSGQPEFGLRLGSLEGTGCLLFLSVLAIDSILPLTVYSVVVIGISNSEYLGKHAVATKHCR